MHSPVVLPAIDGSVSIALIGPTSEGPPLLTQSLRCHWPERRLMGQLVYESFLFVCSSEQLQCKPDRNEENHRKLQQ